MPTVNKVIVTNMSALRKKHGTKGVKRINGGLNALIRADAKRGFVTEVVAIDRKSDMKGIGKPVTKAADRRQAKRAVDDVCNHFTPNYLVLLGAPDVVPHQHLDNPVYSPPADTDLKVESDLPYACATKYSKDINDFLGPTRVVGRLPDVTGDGDTDYLLRLLKVATGWKTKSKTSYRKCFGISAEVWKHSTRTSVRKLFGTQKGVNVSPTDGPNWTKQELRDRIHFVNCHGDTAKPEFYGEDEDRFSIAHRSTHLAARINAATVVAAECCYGAEVYEPSGAGPTGICQAYLGEGAWGFFGSTTIAYGPAVGNGYADLICIEFIRAVLEGASLDRAALTAQQKYIATGGHMDPHGLKTVAQFLLLGDPSIHPVKRKRKRKARPKTTKRGARRVKRLLLDPCALRRKYLAKRGSDLGMSTASVRSKADARLSLKLRRQILRRVKGLEPLATLSFRLRAKAKAATSVVAKKLTGGKTKTTFHILMESPDTAKPRGKRRVTKRHAAKKAVAASTAPSKPPVPTARVVVVREVDGRLDSLTEIYRH